MAVDPPALLALDKQRRLCLTDRHSGCATFLAATGGGPDDLDADGVDSPARRAKCRPGSRIVVRTAPLILDRGRPRLVPVALQATRLGQAALITLLGVAFLAILIARPTLGDGGAGSLAGGGATASPSASAGVSAAPTETPTRTVAPTATPTATPPPSSTPTPGPTPTATPSSTPAATATAAPSAVARTYKVKSGDTLIGIANQFGTTWQILAKLNQLEDPTRLKVGQVLQLP